MCFVRRFAILCLVASVFAVRPAAGATITLQTSPFVGAANVEDFEDAGFDPFYTFSASSGTRRLTSASASSGVTSSGTWGLTTNSFPDPISIAFANPVFGAGMFFGNDDRCCTAGFTAFLDIFDAGNVLLGTVGVVANMNDFVDQFIGFTSDTAASSMTIRYGTGSNVGLFHYIDDVQVNAVPEPATLLLLGSGVAAAIRQRRRKQADPE
jgi:PEP-CTERM motif-containing protein